MVFENLTKAADLSQIEQKIQQNLLVGSGIK